MTPLCFLGLTNRLLTVRCVRGVTRGGLHPHSLGHAFFQQQSIVSSAVSTSGMRVMRNAPKHQRTVSMKGLTTTNEKP